MVETLRPDMLAREISVRADLPQMVRCLEQQGSLAAGTRVQTAHSACSVARAVLCQSLEFEEQGLS